MAQVVVGAAVLRHGRLLAARRSAPDALAGGWEFPGGKVELGESEHDALVRECAEELGVRVHVGPRVGPDAVLPAGRVLKVWWASIEDESEPAALQDHDLLCWLDPDRLSSVAWLPADWPVVHAVADALCEESPLAGGRVGGAVRVGDTVRRPTGAWTPAVHALLEHLRQQDVAHLPEPLGLDEHGREVFRFVHGQTVGDADPVPAQFRSERLVGQVGRWLRTMHIATASLPSQERTWRRGRLARLGSAVVCHNDVSPNNVVLDDDGGLSVVVDWDMAAPGHPGDDLAFAAWQFVLRHGLTLSDEAAGIDALAAGYGGPVGDPVAVLDRVAPRLRGAVRFMRRGAASGDVGLQRLLTTGIPEATERGVRSVLDRRDDLVALLTA